MKFSAFYIAAGIMLGVAATKTSVETPGFGMLFGAAFICVILGAAFEACNPGGK